MTRYLPICLNVSGQPVLVVGGGAVGTQKVADFDACGARVTVISPVASEAIRERARAGRLTLHLRHYEAGDAEGFFLVMVATDDPATNAQIYAEASARGQLVNVCDDPPHCNFIFPSKIERGPLTLALFTHGTSPTLSKRVRRELERVIGPEYAELAELMAALRPRVRAAPGLTQRERQAIYERIVYSDVLYLLREGETEAARARVDAILAEMLPG